MYTSELADIVFAIKFMKAPSSNFDITRYLSFTARSTRSAAQGKLKHVTMPNNKQGTHILIDFFTFGMPPVDLPVGIYKQDKFLWSHFISNFKSDNTCSYHFVCPCSKCTDIPHLPNFK